MPVLLALAALLLAACGAVVCTVGYCAWIVLAHLAKPPPVAARIHRQRGERYATKGRAQPRPNIETYSDLSSAELREILENALGWKPP